MREDHQNICYHDNGRRRGKGSSQKRTLPLFRSMEYSNRHLSHTYKTLRSNAILVQNFIGYRVHSMSARDFVAFGIAGCRRNFAGCRRRGYRRGTSRDVEEEDIDVGLPGMQKKRISTRDFRGCRRRHQRRGTSLIAEEDSDAGLGGCRRRGGYRRWTT